MQNNLTANNNFLNNLKNYLLAKQLIYKFSSTLNQNYVQHVKASKSKENIFTHKFFIDTKTGNIFRSGKTKRTIANIYSDNWNFIFGRLVKYFI